MKTEISPDDVQFTPAEQRILPFLAQGQINRVIAGTLNVSPRTIETHVSNMLSKTSLSNRTELAAWAIKNSLVEGVSDAAC